MTHYLGELTGKYMDEALPPDVFERTAACYDAIVRAHRPLVAELLAGTTGMPLDVMQRVIARVPAEVLPMTPDIVQSQQRVANRFRALGLLPVDITVADIVWRATA